MINSIVLSAATALIATAVTPTTRECIWEAPGKARVTVTYYMQDKRYLRYNDVRVEILDKEGFIAASPESRHGKYWFIFARDSAGELAGRGGRLRSARRQFAAERHQGHVSVATGYPAVGIGCSAQRAHPLGQLVVARSAMESGRALQHLSRQWALGAQPRRGACRCCSDFNRKMSDSGCAGGCWCGRG